MTYDLQDGCMIGRHWRTHNTCEIALDQTVSKGVIRIYHPPSVSFSFANCSNLPGSIARSIEVEALASRGQFTSIEKRDLSGVGLPEVLTLVQGILRCASLLHVGVVWVGHGC